MKTASGPLIGDPDLTQQTEDNESDVVDTTATPTEQRALTWKTAPPDFIQASYEDMHMLPLLPHFSPYPPALHKMLPVDSIPNPREVSTTLPTNIELVWETPQVVDPQVAFDFYTRGVAATALVVQYQFMPVIKAALLQLTELIRQGQSLPTIDEQYIRYVSQCERAIFCNGEHHTWRPLVAFMQGSFWLLSYINRPTRRRGNYSPLEFVHSMVRHYGSLGYVPS